ncbi:MAG: glycerol-3-phosphate 1-O-acyltransferase PlsY [Candidatus Marinimicrobia bacterium]|nr:glycerol-3-phosphate 1-O-acyltransferase PlsY [Candidatus Neomarinimicrobiota bacterium]
MAATIFILIFAFLTGSIPTGYLLVKKNKQIDLRKVGSGNIGSTNVRRAAGIKLSILTQLLDMLKGLLPVAIVLFSYNFVYFNLEKTILMIITAFCAILGHDFTPFLKFKGGKGVNTTLGAFFPILPVPVILCGLSFKILKIVTPIVSVRSLAISLLLPIYTWITVGENILVFATLGASLLIILLHRDNLLRIIQKTEV